MFNLRSPNEKCFGGAGVFLLIVSLNECSDVQLFNSGSKLFHKSTVDKK